MSKDPLVIAAPVAVTFAGCVRLLNPVLPPTSDDPRFEAKQELLAQQRSELAPTTGVSIGGASPTVRAGSILPKVCVGILPDALGRDDSKPTRGWIDANAVMQFVARWFARAPAAKFASPGGIAPPDTKPAHYLSSQSSKDLPREAGEHMLFANDWTQRYRNNQGHVDKQVRHIDTAVSR